jgi:4Fe-4S single cluster domain of Ferredoxin I
MAPKVFTRVGPQSAVYAQPTDAAGRIQALQALLSCPTSSIHARQRDAAELRAARDGLPLPVAGAPGVYSCGFRSIKGLACESYLLVRPSGNVLIDAPRFNPALAENLQRLGGVTYMFLTHK